MTRGITTPLLEIGSRIYLTEANADVWLEYIIRAPMWLIPLHGGAISPLTRESPGCGELVRFNQLRLLVASHMRHPR